MPRTSAPWTAAGGVVAVALGAAALRALAFAGTEVYADEAYYWLWSRRPAAGYFDHPPLVAWLAAAAPAAGAAPGGAPAEWALRLPFLAAGALAIAAAGLLARGLAGPDEPGATRAALLGALLCAAAPLGGFLGAMALPDAPLAAAYTAAVALLARARGPRWLAVGAAAGVALLAKYTAALLAPAILLAAIWDGELRRELRTPWPWLAAAVALAVFSPCLAWNARHGWVSFRFQLAHGLAGGATLASAAAYAAGQVAGAGPVALAGGVALLARGRTPAGRRVAAAALVPLAALGVAALRGKVEANWPAFVHPALAAAAGAWLAGLRPRPARALAVASVALGALALGGFALLQRHPGPFVAAAAYERFHGWREGAAAVRAAAARACAGTGCDPRQPFVVPYAYQHAAQLAFYGGFRRLGATLERPSQLDVWGERPAPGEPCLVVAPGSAHARALSLVARRAEARPERGGARGDAEARPLVPDNPASERVMVRRGGALLRELVVTPLARCARDGPGR